MKQDSKRARQDDIERAAYELLEAHGYDGMSMLAVARRAKASNETLYRWYGNKQGLFKILVARNAAEVETLLLKDIERGRPPMETLEAVSPRLLRLLCGDKAIALNRAAAADATGELGVAIAEEGRARVLPLINKVFSAAQSENQFAGAAASVVADVYLRLLVGDLQIRRAIGVIGAPTPRVIRARADDAMEMLRKIFPSAESI